MPHDEPLDVVCVLAHAARLLQLRADDGLARLVLLAHVVVVDQPVAALQGGKLGGCKGREGWGNRPGPSKVLL